MLKVINGIGFVALAALMSACGTLQNIRPGSVLKMDDGSAILMLGLNPKYRIHLIRGPVANGVWDRTRLDIPEINLYPENGYVIVKARPTKANERMSVSLVFTEDNAFGPCQDSIGPTFSLKAGVVNYVGELIYSYDGKSLSFDTGVDEEKARKVLSELYPAFLEKLETHPMSLMKIDSSLCNPGTVTIPIFVPRH